MSGGGGSGGGGGSNRQRRPTKGRPGASKSSVPNKTASGGRTSPARRHSAEADFWGRPPESPPAVAKIKPTGAPAALPRSLGDPPLGPNPAAAAHHLAVIYEEAVRAGTALAAASGLLDDDVMDGVDPGDQ